MPHSAVMRSEISSARARISVGGAVQDSVALVARELRPVAAGDRERAANVVDRGLGHGADERAGVRIADLDDAARRRPRSPAMRIFASQHGAAGCTSAVRSSCSSRRALQVVEREVERIEVAPAALAAARRRVRLAISGTRCSDVPPCERSGASRPDRSCRSRLVPITVSRSETTTRSPTRSGGSSNVAQACSRV